MIGQVLLKRYKIQREIGEGGMSRVYQARQLDLDRDVAVKVLLPQIASNPKARDHFRREVHILSQFQHAHSITYYDAQPDGNPPILVMELVRGSELTHLLQRSKRFRPERAGRLLGQLCDVLHTAHEKGIVHRDIKPANILVMFPESPVEKIKLMDFGLAKMESMFYLSPVEMVNMAQPTASGTPEYISPEQVRGNDVDRRSDVYSVGVLLYEMLTGRRPFESDDVGDLLEAHLDEKPPTFYELGLRDEISPALEQVVMDCLTKYPEDRIKSCVQLAERFEKALGRKIWTRTHTGQMPLTEDGKPAVVYRTRPGSASGVRPALESGVRPALSSGVRASLSGQGIADAGEAPIAERNAITHRCTARMIESMAMIKLRGFIHDLGGEIVDSVPGTIKVRIRDREQTKSGMLGWFGGSSSPKKTTPSIDMEMRMEKREGSQLAITLVLRSPNGLFNTEGKTRCEQICRDLSAYLMGAG